MRSFIAAVAAALFLSGPVAAFAQDQPSYAQPAPQPGVGDGQIRGRIVSFDGGYNAQVRDDKGFIDNVQLHQGTIINPTGITLAPGMVVSILGYNAGSYFGANEIDTPYTFYGGAPYYAGHPWNYYGPTIGLGFYFGNVGWWHGNGFYGGYRSYGGVRVYNNVNVNTVYRGGTYQGRNYAAPPSHGGYVPSGYHGTPSESGGYHGGGNGGGSYHGGGGGYHGGGGAHGH